MNLVRIDIAGLGVEFMSKRKKGYVELVIVLIIFLMIFAYFNLPEETLIIFGVIAIFNIFIFELFVWRK